MSSAVYDKLSVGQTIPIVLRSLTEILFQVQILQVAKLGSIKLKIVPKSKNREFLFSEVVVVASCASFLIWSLAVMRYFVSVDSPFLNPVLTMLLYDLRIHIITCLFNEYRISCKSQIKRPITTEKIWLKIQESKI